LPRLDSAAAQWTFDCRLDTAALAPSPLLIAFRCWKRSEEYGMHISKARTAIFVRNLNDAGHFVDHGFMVKHARSLLHYSANLFGTDHLVRRRLLVLLNEARRRKLKTNGIG
jgi:hypothetical protein